MIPGIGLCLALTHLHLNTLQPLEDTTLLQKETPRYLENYWYYSIEYAQGARVLGSGDQRTGFLFAANYVKPEPLAKFEGAEGQFVYTLYYMKTRGKGIVGQDLPVLHSYGLMVTSRYWGHFIRGLDTYFEFGWGLVFNNVATRDVDSKINSTPVIGVGAAVPILESELLLAIRYYHQSNAGLEGTNRGLNSINFSVGIRF